MAPKVKVIQFRSDESLVGWLERRNPAKSLGQAAAGEMQLWRTLSAMELARTRWELGELQALAQINKGPAISTADPHAIKVAVVDAIAQSPGVWAENETQLQAKVLALGPVAAMATLHAIAAWYALPDDGNPIQSWRAVGFTVDE